MESNTVFFDTLCAALCYAMGIEPPAHAAPANRTLCDYVDQALHGLDIPEDMDILHHHVAYPAAEQQTARLL